MSTVDAVTTALACVPKSYHYRIEDYLESAGVDEFDNPLGPPRVRVVIRKFEVKKVTAKGVWLDRGLMGSRFVKSGTIKRYSCPTLAEALESFKARKRKQISILSRKISNAEEALQLAMLEVEATIRGVMPTL